MKSPIFQIFMFFINVCAHELLVKFTILQIFLLLRHFAAPLHFYWNSTFFRFSCFLLIWRTLDFCSTLEMLKSLFFFTYFRQPHGFLLNVSIFSDFSRFLLNLSTPGFLLKCSIFLVFFVFNLLLRTPLFLVKFRIFQTLLLSSNFQRPWISAEIGSFPVSVDFDLFLTAPGLLAIFDFESTISGWISYSSDWKAIMWIFLFRRLIFENAHLLLNFKFLWVIYMTRLCGGNATSIKR